AMISAGKRNAAVGTALNEAAAVGNFAPLGSGTDTRKAPAVGAWLTLAQCATSKQARLCATSTVGPSELLTSRSTAAVQSANAGASQLDGLKRLKLGSPRSHRVCQCSSPDPPTPGRVTNVALICTS